MESNHYFVPKISAIKAIIEDFQTITTDSSLSPDDLLNIANGCLKEIKYIVKDM